MKLKFPRSAGWFLLGFVALLVIAADVTTTMFDTTYFSASNTSVSLKGSLTNWAKLATNQAAGGTAGGALAGNYPNPQIASGVAISNANLIAPVLTKASLFEGLNLVTRYGATGNGVTDDTVAIQAAIAATPSGGVLFFPLGTYIVSNTLACPLPITIEGVGTGIGRSTILSPSANFPSGVDFITLSGGSSVVKNMASFMNRRGGNWLTFIGDSGVNRVEYCFVSGVASNYWGIELRDPAGPNGIGLTQIDANFFYDFDGGAVFGNGGGDSDNITRNVFQLVNSSSYIIKWNGASGAANLNIFANNATGAGKFIEINYSQQFKIMGNQLEATTPITSTSGAMITVNGSASGWTIHDNNINGHNTNANVAIYLDNAVDGVIANNTILNVVSNYIQTTANSARIKYYKGVQAGTLNDSIGAVSTIDPNGATTLRGSLSTTGNISTSGTVSAAGAINSSSTNISSFIGNVGIGAASAPAPVSITSPSGEIARTTYSSDSSFYHSLFGGYSATPGSSYLAYKINNGTSGTSLEVIRMVGTGNIGIGTNAPSEKLEVLGNIKASGNLTVNGQYGSTGTTCANLPTGVAAGYQTYCTDCLTPVGTGDDVKWNGTNWTTMRLRIMATTTNSVYILSAASNAVNIATAISDIAIATAPGNSPAGSLGRAFTGTGSGAAASQTSSTALGSGLNYSTGTTTNGSARSTGNLWNTIQSGDTYANGGMYAVSVAPDGTDNYWSKAAGFDSLATTNFPINGVFFLQDKYNLTGHGQSYTNDWICVSAKASSYTYADSGLAFTVSAGATALDNLKVIMTSTNATFFTNGVACATIASNIPAVALFSNQTENLKVGGTTARFLFEYNPWYSIRRATGHSY